VVQIHHFPLDQFPNNWYNIRVEKSTAAFPFGRFRNGGDRNLLYGHIA